MEATTLAPNKPVEQTEKSDTMNATHRCDTGSCGSQAYYKVFFNSGDYLLFCNHHFGANKEALKEVWLDHVDESWKLKQDRLQGSEN